MADTFELEIATPERLLVREQVDEVQIPGKEDISASCRATRRC